MDLLQELPEYKGESLLQNEVVAAFGLTFQGASHKQSAPPVLSGNRSWKISGSSWRN